MNKWNMRPGQPIDPETTKKIAFEIWQGLVYFAIMKSHDPKKKAALEELTILRCKVQEQLDILAPGYLE